MRAIATASLLVSSLFAASCVNEDAIPAYVSVEYQLRCLGACSTAADGPVRSIYHVDGEDDLDVRCGVSTAGGKNVISFSTYCRGGSAACGKDEVRFEISGIALDSKDGDPGGSCKITVDEGANSYESACTNGEIEGDTRCKIAYKVDRENSELTGTVRCVDFVDPSTPDNNERYLVAPASQDPVKFIAQGCKGL